MMRSAFLALVGLNLLLLLVQFLLPTPPSLMREAVPVQQEGPRLRLLSEPEASQVIRPRVQPALERELQAPGARCVLVGAFAESAPAEAMVEYLRALDVHAQVQALEVPDGAGYWVYLPPEISKQEALRRLYELQANRVDSYIIPRGDLANGISLGMFSRENLARARRDELRGMGYPAEIHEITRTHREIWVIMPASEAEKLATSLWQELLSRESGLEQRQNLCPGVASG